MHAQSLRSCPTLCDPMNCSLPGSCVHSFSRQEYWMGSRPLLQGIFPTQGSNLRLLHLLHWQAVGFFFFFFFFTTGTTWEVLFIVAINQYKCLPADDWINRKWYIHKIEYKLALKSLKVFLISEKNRWQPWNYVILCIFSVQRKLI